MNGSFAGVAPMSNMKHGVRMAAEAGSQLTGLSCEKAVHQTGVKATAVQEKAPINEPRDTLHVKPLSYLVLQRAATRSGFTKSGCTSAT